MTKKQSNLWWGSPANFSERKNERKVSWLELFYDLVYVAAIGQLTQRIAAGPSWEVLGTSFLLFSLLFWSWVNGSQYYDLHGKDSIRSRLLTFWQMLAVAASAITIHDVFEGHRLGFAISFSVIQGVVLYLWWSVGLYDPSHRVFNKYYSINYGIAFILLILSAFTGGQMTLLLWILVLVLNLTAPLIAARTVVSVLKKRGEEFTASATIVERFGLFTIIVLTESILSVVSGVAAVKDKHPAIWIAFILGILIAFLLWSLYFDMTSEQETKKGYSYMQWLVFLHFPLLASLSITGACIKVLISGVEAGFPPKVQWIFCGSLSTILFMIVALSRIMQEDEEDRAYIRPVSVWLVYAGLCIGILPLWGKHLSALPFLAIIALILFVPVFIGIRSWVRYKFFGRH